MPRLFQWRAPIQILALILGAVLTLPIAQALGVSTPVLQDNTIEVPERAESTMFTISLQNGDQQNISVKVLYSSDSGIANVIGYKDVYFLPSGAGTSVTFNITLPQSAKVNDEFTLSYTVIPVSAQSGGLIPLSAGISRSIKVKVSKNPDRFYLGYYIQETGKTWLVVMAVLAAYVAYSIRKRRKRGK